MALSDRLKYFMMSALGAPDLRDELANAIDANTAAQTGDIHSNGSIPFVANQPMGGFKLTGLAAGSVAGDSIRYEQAILASGANAFSGDQSMGSHKLINVTDPSSAQDAATKNYVDTTGVSNFKKDGSVLATGDFNLNSHSMNNLVSANPVSYNSGSLGSDALNWGAVKSSTFVGSGSVVIPNINVLSSATLRSYPVFSLVNGYLTGFTNVDNLTRNMVIDNASSPGTNIPRGSIIFNIDNYYTFTVVAPSVAPPLGSVYRNNGADFTIVSAVGTIITAVNKVEENFPAPLASGSLALIYDAGSGSDASIAFSAVTQVFQASFIPGGISFSGSVTPTGSPISVSFTQALNSRSENNYINQASIGTGFAQIKSGDLYKYGATAPTGALVLRSGEIYGAGATSTSGTGAMSIHPGDIYADNCASSTGLFGLRGGNIAGINCTGSTLGFTMNSGSITGANSTGSTGNTTLASGGISGASATGNSGLLSINSGNITGAGATGNSGAVTIKSGNALAGVSGSVTLTTGNATGNSGNLILNTGTSSATRGVIQAQVALSMSSNLINNVLNPVSAQDAATKNYVDNKVLVFTSTASGGGSATPTFVVTGILATDVILSVSQSVPGANNLPLLGFNTLANNALNGVYSADPGGGSVIVVSVKR